MPTPATKTLLVEGWRGIPHSYAMVNQHQLLELSRRPEITLYHRDLPFAFPNWRAAPGLFSPEQESRLRSIPSPPPGLRSDALLRMGWPHFFHGDPSARRTFTWVTSEGLTVENISIGTKKPARAALPTVESDIIACSTWAAQGFANCGAPPKKISVVPCGVDATTFSPPSPEQRAALRRQLGWEGRLVLLNVSAMTDNKGIKELLKAAATLALRFPSLLIALKGTDSLYPSQQYSRGALAGLPPADAAALAQRITYIGGTLSTDAIVRYYQAADVYASPYLAEGFNLPVLEAAACGLPVVCTRGGSTEDFVDDSFTLRVQSTLTDFPGTNRGKCLRPDPAHLVAQLTRALEDADFRTKAAESGPAWVRSRFTWSHSVDKLLIRLFAQS